MVILQIKEWDGQRRQIEVETAGRTLLSILQEQQIYLDAPCNGKGTCGKCRVRFLEGAPKPDEKEKKLLSEKELSGGIRLACVTKINRDCIVQFLEDGQEDMVALAGAAEAYKKETDRAGDYGIAIDIGTTTLAAALLDLSSGKTVAVTTGVNHQRAYGADVIARIAADNEGKGGALREWIQKDLREMIGQLLNQADCKAEEVKKVAVAGNTTMCHLLLGFPCKTLGESPFAPVDISLMKKSYQEIFETEELSCPVTVLPGISAFVGADIVAGIYESGMQKQEETSLLLDIGTNGEMVIGNRDGLLATSAAAGPVFEGGNLSCGVPGIPGAITHVALKEGEGEREFQGHFETIENLPPVGLCGTGIVDAVSELVRLGILDENGNLGEPWFDEGFPIAGEKIRFQERDVREIQMGKAAIRAGIDTIIQEYGKEPERIYLAGGFGTCMNVESAIRIGLFPESFRGKVVPVGNSALAGAARLLVEGADGKRQICGIPSMTREINLAMHSRFQELYLESMFF